MSFLVTLLDHLRIRFQNQEFSITEEHTHTHNHENTPAHSGKGKDVAKVAPESEHDHEHSMIDDHSLIGITLVSGFIFMLLVDQIGGGSHHMHTPAGTCL